MKKSIEVANKEYPDGKIKSTQMVVYSYPSIGAMTVVKDKNTGDEHRIFVDAYTLDAVPDKPATETEPGVLSMFEQRLKNGMDKNLIDWQESDQITKSVEQEATNKGINISVPITEENMEKLSGDATITSTETLDVPLYGQEESNYCGPACGQMLAEYYGKTQSQDYIYGIMGGGDVYLSDILDYCKSPDGLYKTRSTSTTTDLTFAKAVYEINYNRPFISRVWGGTMYHVRVCIGYTSDNGDEYLQINDPAPVGSDGTYRLESPGSENARIYVRT